MDFKNILQSLTSLSEATKETGKGRVHKAEPGGYGRKYDTDEEGDENAEKKPSSDEKRGRGRPKKGADDSGNVKKYDTDALGTAMGVGKAPKKPIGKTSVKHSLKDWIEHVGTSIINEEEQVTIAPAQQNTQVIKQGDKTLGTVTNPQLAQQIKQSLGKGEMSLASDEIDEDAMDEAVRGTVFGKQGYRAPQNQGERDTVAQTIKQNRAQNRADTRVTGYGNKVAPQRGVSSADTGGARGSAVNVDQSGQVGDFNPGIGNIDPRAQGYRGALNLGKTSQGKGIVGEKAPPGEKAERMVKHIKKGYSKDGKLTPKEKSIAFATAWKAHNKGKVEEESIVGQDVLSPKEKLAPHAGMGKGKLQQKLGQAGIIAKNIGRFLKGKPEIPTMEGVELSDGTILTEGDIKRRLNLFLDELVSGTGKFNINTAVELQDKALANRIIDRTLQHGAFKHLPGTMKGQLRDFALEEFGFTDYDQSLEEDDPVLPKLLQKRPVVAEPSAFAPTREVTPFTAGTPEKGNFLSGLRKSAPTLESEDMKDIQFESWENQLNGLLTEGLTVSSSTGQQGSPDSVTISATDSDAQELLNIVRKAGLGVFGGGEQAVSHDGHDSALMSVPGEEADGSGTEPETSPEVVGDGDDMLALIKKMSGISAQPTALVSVDSEEDSEDSEDYADEEDSEEDYSDEDDSEESEEEHDSEESDEDEVEEGNAFTGALAKAKSDGIQKGEKMSVGGKTYPVKEDDMEEGNAFTGKLKSTPKGGDFELDGKKYKDTSGLDEEALDQPATMEEETCNECGMNESQCGCSHMEESFANDVGGDAMAAAELLKLKSLLSMGNDLHREKQDQTVGNPTRVSVRESLNEWKKLSGIK